MQQLRDHFTRLYGDRAGMCLKRLRMVMGRCADLTTSPGSRTGHWDESDSILIAYPDMVQSPDRSPLRALRAFLATHVSGLIRTVHILPFAPSSSDDGFSVIDHRTVEPSFGTWPDVAGFTGSFDLMMDVVINHASLQSNWAKDYVRGIQPARDYFIEMAPETDLADVVRPRSSPLLTPVRTDHGTAHLWTTFSADQLDLDFSNPDVLFEFIDILLHYVRHGARFIRLDAIAYLWKEVGTPCIHLPQTHEVVKLFRAILSLLAPHVILLTETNVPHEENVSYFGAGDEAHMVYQFTLPPLLLHALLSGSAARLTEWARSFSRPPEGCTFLNFSASHDGIGVRPLEGVLSTREMADLVQSVRERGGDVSTKRNADGSESPYELNITYFDALSDPAAPTADAGMDRFLCSQAIVLALRGIPAVYFNNLMLARNDHQGVERAGHARAINRKKWGLAELSALMADSTSLVARVFSRYSRMLRLRAANPAFHPNAAQEVLDLGDSVFCLRRTALHGDAAVLCVSNVTSRPARVSLGAGGPWQDLISGNREEKGVDRLVLLPYQTCWLVTP